MSRRTRVRRQSRRSICWPVFYGCDELAGGGTVLDMSETGCRIVGCTPVEPGMRLRLCVWLSRKPEDMWVIYATVIWAKGLQFGIVVHASGGEGQTWPEEGLSQSCQRNGETDSERNSCLSPGDWFNVGRSPLRPVS